VSPEDVLVQALHRDLQHLLADSERERDVILMQFGLEMVTLTL